MSLKDLQVDSSRRKFLRTTTSAALACGCLGVPLTGHAETSDAAPAAAAGTYICPPCGLPCDKLVFDTPGKCPNCGMTLVPTGSSAEQPPKVAILLFNGAQLIDFAGPWEVFGTAGFLVHTVAEKKEMLTAVFGEKIMPDYTVEDSPKPNILLIPGGGVWDEAINNPRVIEWMQTKAREADYVISVCTGAFLLQKAGLLAGQTVTSTYGMIDDLKAPDTKVVYDKRFVSNQKVITTAGLTAGIDGALHVVSRLKGLGVAQATALEMEYNWDPSGNYARAALADRFLPDGLAFAKPKLKGVIATMLSTAGDREHWETRIVVSEPHTQSEVVEALRDRVAASKGRSGMFKPVFHVRGETRIVAQTDTDFTWAFSDDEGHDWKGRCTVAPDDMETNKFIAALTLHRA